MLLETGCLFRNVLVVRVLLYTYSIAQRHMLPFTDADAPRRLLLPASATLRADALLSTPVYYVSSSASFAFQLYIATLASARIAFVRSATSRLISSLSLDDVLHQWYAYGTPSCHQRLCVGA